jgi:hypothetical protein
MKVPENAREQLRATLKSMDMQPDKHWVDVPRWAVPLVLAYLDIQDAANEAVTEEMVASSVDAATEAFWSAPDDADPREVTTRASIQSAAPALLLAGERRGLERATADYERRADERCAEADACDAAGDSAGAAAARELASHYRLTAHELRAFGRPA